MWPSCFNSWPEKHKLDRGRWKLASCQVSLNSVQEKSKMSRSIRGNGGHLVFRISLKNTNLVEDVEILLPVKFGWIPFSSFRGEVKKCLSQSEARAAILFLYARLVGTYYGMALASVRLSVHKSCKHDTDWTVSARTVKLGTHTTYDKRMNPIDFQGLGSKVKVTRFTLLLNLVNTIQTEPFQLGLSKLVHILLMTRGRHLLIFKVMGQRSRSHAKPCCLTL